MKHIPKSNYCLNCTKQFNDCSKLDFKSMPTISRKPQRQTGFILVKCTEFEKK